MKILDLLKNKFALIAVSSSLFILLLVIILSPKKSSQTLPKDDSTTQQNTPLELIDLSQAKRQSAMVYVESIENKLPIYLESFTTSVGIKTSINLYRLTSDPAEIVRLEIYGLSYLNKDELDPIKNPNITAFKESYLKALELLESKNIDPKKLIFIYGDKNYVRTTASYWADKLKITP